MITQVVVGAGVEWETWEVAEGVGADMDIMWQGKFVGKKNRVSGDIGG